MAEDWAETDPEELERQRKKMEEINAANPGGEDYSKSYVEGGETGGWLKGVGETLEAGRSTTSADRDRYIAEAREAGASDEYMQDFLARNPGDFSRLKRVWLDETVDQPDSNNTDRVDPNVNYNYGPSTGGGTEGGGGGGGGTDWTTQGPTTTTPTGGGGGSTDWRSWNPSTPVTPAGPPPSTTLPASTYTAATGTNVPAARTQQPQAPPIVAPKSVLDDVPNANTVRMQEQLAASQAQDDARSKELWDRLEGRSNQSLAIDRNDPIIRAQADAYGANESRASNEYLADLAEGSNANANLLGEQRLAAERRGQRTGAFEAELMGRELSARREEISGALAGMGGMLTADQQRSLTRELALMDNAIKENQLQLTQRDQDINFSLGQGRLNLDAELGRGRLDLDDVLGRGNLALEEELGRGQLNLNNDRLGLDRGRLDLDAELGRGKLGLDQKGMEQDWYKALMGHDEFGQSQAQDWKKALMQDEQFDQSQNQDWKVELMRNEQFMKRLGLDASMFGSDDDYRRSYIK